MKNKKFKSILSLVLVVVLVLTGVVGSVFMFWQSKAVVNDTTVAGQVSEETKGTGGERKAPQAIISSSVTMFDGDKATAINSAITTATGTSAGLYLNVKKGTDIDELGVGDIFFLEGSEATPLGEPYFGKVVSAKTVGDEVQFLMETPMVDEVFDSVCFSTTELFKDGTDATFEALDGVSVISGGKEITAPVAEPVSSVSSEPTVVNLSASNSAPAVEEMSLKSYTFNPKERLELKLDVDLLEAYKKIRGVEEKKEAYPQGSNSTKVVTTERGKVYHNEDCFHLKTSKTAKKVDLSHALDEGKRPCKACKPAVLSNTSTDTSLTLTGAVGVENLMCDIYYDWNIIDGAGINDFWVNVTGTAFSEVNVVGTGEMKLGGNDTEWSSPFEIVKIQGLKEKLFPIGYISLTQGLACTYANGSNTVVRTQVSVMPISVLIMVYVDVQGNLTFSVSAGAKTTRNFSYDYKLVENGAVKMQGELKTEKPNVEWGIDVGVEGDVDAHVGLSALAYVFNINVADVGLLKIGSEAEGKLALSVNQDTVAGKGSWYEASYFSRAYVKIIDVKLLLRCSVELLKGIISFSGEFNYDWILLDYTLAYWGKRLPTVYTPGQMKCSLVTAQDKDAVYYKDEDGRLIMDRDGYKKILYDEEFFVFCAIDESYIYILKNKDGGSHAMYRVSKENGTAKEMLNDVNRVLYADEEYIYYVDNFSKNTIRKMKREDGKVSTFAQFEHEVQVMNEQDMGLYVTTADVDGFSWFFGSTAYYYLIGKDGKVIRDYGSRPEISEYSLKDGNDFYKAAKLTQGGTLRNTASEVYWLSKDKSQSVLAEGISGWVIKESVGIFTTMNNTISEMGLPFEIVVYRGINGARERVTSVASNQAFFTLTRGVNGDWYFFDQTDTELILYSMDKDYKNKQKLKAFSLDELNYSLTNCGMEIADNCLYFYTIEDEKVCKVIKRYNLY